MRQLLSFIISSVILFSSVSAQALNFTTSAFVEWSFSGIQTHIESRGTAGGTIFVGNIQGGIRGVDFVGGPVCCPEFVRLPGTGTAAATLTGSSLSTTATLVGSGTALAAFGWTFDVVANEVGWSNLTVNYRFHETGTVPLGTSLLASSNIHLSSFVNPSFGLPLCVTENCSGFNRSVETVVHGDQSLNITRTITGTFTGSHFFDTNNSRAALIFSATSHVVPEPASLSLFGLGLAGLAALRRTFSGS